MNPFKFIQERKQEAIAQQAEGRSMAYGFATSNESAMETASVLEKKEVMVKLTQWQQDRKPAMQKLFLNLSGLTFNESTRRLEDNDWNKGIVSPIGAKKLVDYIETMDHNVMLGNNSEEHILGVMLNCVAQPLRRYIRYNHGMLGLQVRDAEYVLNLIENTLEPNFWRGFNDGERKKDSQIIKINELQTPPPAKQKSVWGLGG